MTKREKLAAIDTALEALDEKATETFKDYDYEYDHLHHAMEILRDKREELLKEDK